MKNVTAILNRINHRDNIIYRGHADKEWVLKPSIGRHYNRDWSEVVEFEEKSLLEFKKRTIPYLKYEPKADIEWLCLMQHHGLSTRLLDFTKNPLIALFFASDPTVSKDGELIIAQYGNVYENVKDEDLFNRKKNFAYHPPHITERIIGQQGCFVYSSTPNKPLNNKQIENILIPERQKLNIRRELAILGICHSGLFPGIDGTCLDMNDNLIGSMLDKECPF